MSMASSCFRVPDSIRRSCYQSGVPQIIVGCNIPDKQQRGLIPCSSSSKGYCNLSDRLESESRGIAPTVSHLANCVEQSVKLNNTVKGRVMLIDGTYMIYRAYYKILARLDRDRYWNADGNGDWVYTISRALSLILDVLELGPLHVAVVFDHDGEIHKISSGRASASFRENIMEKVSVGKHKLFQRNGPDLYLLNEHSQSTNFHHILYPSYKGHRNATPDTVIQGLQYFKLSLRAMSIPVIQVPGVEADDVIGTLSVNSVADGFKVRVVSPDRDFFQLISPAVRLLRITPRGSEYGDLKPSQFVDMVSLMGDKTDNIPEVNGIEDADALKLIIKFGTFENLLKCVDQLEEENIKKALVSNADQAILNKNLLTLRSDLSFQKVPFTTSDLLFRKPKDDGEKFRNLLTAISAYAEGHSAEHLIRRADNLWKQHTTASLKQ